MSFSCPVAISKGRYTHEKITNNIKEVLEPPPGGVVALLPKLPLRITEKKYEEVIAHILAVYQEQSWYTMSFFTNMKVWEDIFLVSLCLSYSFRLLPLGVATTDFPSPFVPIVCILLLRCRVFSRHFYSFPVSSFLAVPSSASFCQ